MAQYHTVLFYAVTAALLALALVSGLSWLTPKLTAEEIEELELRSRYGFTDWTLEQLRQYDAEVAYRYERWGASVLEQV